MDFSQLTSVIKRFFTINRYIFLDVAVMLFLVGLFSLALLFLNGSIFGLLLLIFIVFFNFSIYISWRYQVSLPILSKVKPEWIRKLHRAWKQEENFIKKHIYCVCFHFFHCWHLLARSARASCNLTSKSNNAFANENRRPGSNIELLKEAYLEDLAIDNNNHCQKKSRLTFATLAISSVLAIMVIVFSALFSTQIKAATYGWTQTSWAGGASTTAIAVHPGNQTGWNLYYAKDAAVSAGNGNVSLTAVTSTVVDTSQADFSAGSSTNAYVTTTGAVFMLKPSNATCSSSAECSNASCSGGACFHCGATTDLVAYGGGPFDSNGLTSTTGGYYRTVANGSQCWLKDNIATGTMVSMPADTSHTNTSNNGIIEKYCRSNNLANCTNYGGWYDWAEAVQYAGGVTDSSGSATGFVQGICPSGWHIPYDSDYAALSTAYGGDSTAGSHIKESGTTHWTSGNSSDNSSGFTALGTASFYAALGDDTNIWTMTQANSSNANRRTLAYNANTFSSVSATRYEQNAVRCLHNTSTASFQTNYSTSTFDSSVKDLGAGGRSNLMISWNASTTAASTTATMQIRSGPSATPDGSWTAFTAVTNGQVLTDANSIGNRYVQYRTTMASNELSTVASLNDVTISYSAYPSVATYVTSSIYNSSSTGNVIPKIAWTNANTSTLNTIKFQIRSAASTSSLASATWCGYADTGASCSGSNYFEYFQNGATMAGTNPLMQGGNNQYFQYRIILASGGTSSPALSSVTVTYVVNAPPQFASSTAVSQRTSDGKVLINYSAIDTDTASTGVACPNCVLSTFYYSTDNGDSWTQISTTTLVNASGYTGNNAGIGTTTVASSTAIDYAVLWDAKATLGNFYAINTQLKIQMDDKEGANNTAVTTTVFIIDERNPDLGKAGNSTSTNNGIVVSATTSPATVLLNATDNSPGLGMCLTLSDPGSAVLTSTTPGAACSSFASSTAITLITPNQATVYVQFKDAFNNITNASAATPQQPTGIVTRDISNTVDSPKVYQEFQAWTAANPANFSSYRLWSKIVGVSDWHEIAIISNSSQNYYYHQSLTGGANYYYKVYAQDIYGNASYFSSEVNDITDGVGGTNATPPTISNVTTTNVTTQGVSIIWDTDVLANSTVYYSTVQPGYGTPYDQTLGAITMLDNSAHVGQHHVAMSGLAADQDYWFEVQSVNDLGIAAVDSKGGQGYYFHTLAGPQITGVTANQIANNSATIVWNTNVAADSYVNYSSSSANFLTTYQSTGITDSVTSHSVTLTNLIKGTTYFFSIQSGVASDNNGGNYYYFTTPTDITPPVFMVNATSSVIIDTKALITWTTDELANSKVVYGLTSGLYTDSVIDANYGTNHDVLLQNLTTSTTYYFRAVTADTSGNIATSSELSFTTVYGVTFSFLLGYSSGTDQGYEQGYADGWTAGYASGTIYGYNWGYASGTDYGYNWGYASGTDIEAHTLFNFNYVSGTYAMFLAGTAQGYSEGVTAGYASGTATCVAPTVCVVCPSCGGGGGGSSIDRNKPIISEIGVSAVTDNSATFNWKTDKKSNSFIEYGLDSNYSDNFGKFDSVTSHSITLKKLDSSTLYHYRVASIDENGNLGQSADATFSTTDLLGLPANPLTASSTNPFSTPIFNQNNETLFSDALAKAATYISTMSAKVSLNSVQSAIVSQYNLIKQLSGLVPSPLLGGEPRVIVTSNTAVISWSTDQDSNSLVAIVPDANYDKAKGDSAYQQVIGNSEEQVKSHIVTLYDLLPETVYHYQVRSMALGGAQAMSPDFTFLTKPQQLSISSYNVQNVDNSTAIFQWITTAETNSQVKYIPYRNNVLQIDQAQTVADKNYTTIHNIKVNGFESGVTYQIELSSVDAKNKAIAQKIPDFRTGKDNLPPTIDQVQTESAISLGKQTNVQTVVSWQTNEPATGQVYYQKGAGSADEAKWEKTALDNTYTKKHIIVITKFESGVIYQFKILSADSSGNMSVSKVYTILTPKEKESVFQVIIRNFEDVFGWTGIGG